MKLRIGASGIHLFDRQTGTNILLDEISPKKETWSLAPRHVAIALTNACNLACKHCYAPKHKAFLNSENVLNWASELDKNGTLGLGFGGGEPTLHPDFINLCKEVNINTKLAVSFTTHGHQLDKHMISHLSPYVHFTRLSMDGFGDTYEKIRGRPFEQFLSKLKMIRSEMRYGVNYVVNDETVADLDKLDFLQDLGCEELLLLPQHRTKYVNDIRPPAKELMTNWVESYTGGMKLSVGAYAQDGLPACDIFSKDDSLEGYAHIDADGLLKRSSYNKEGVKITTSLSYALEKLKVL